MNEESFFQRADIERKSEKETHTEKESIWYNFQSNGLLVRFIRRILNAIIMVKQKNILCFTNFHPIYSKQVESWPYIFLKRVRAKCLILCFNKWLLNLESESKSKFNELNDGRTALVHFSFLFANRKKERKNRIKIEIIKTKRKKNDMPNKTNLLT